MLPPEPSRIFSRSQGACTHHILIPPKLYTSPGSRAGHPKQEEATCDPGRARLQQTGPVPTGCTPSRAGPHTGVTCAHWMHPLPSRAPYRRDLCPLDAPPPEQGPIQACSQGGLCACRFGPHESIWRMIKRGREG